MRRFLRFVVRVLLLLVVVVVAAAYYLLGSHSIPARSDYQLDITTLRQLADQQKGLRPVRINAGAVGQAQVPAMFFLGGLRFDRYQAVFPAYQVLYADGSMVLVDAPPGGDFFTNSMPGKLDEPQYQAEQNALTHSRAIVITHEHADHLGGIAQSPELEDFAEHLMLTREQLDSHRWLKEARFPDGIAAALKPLVYDHYYALAPGVVLIKAPGHTTGSQLIYVRLADNSEYLLIGDVAWAMEQVTIPHCRPRLAELLIGENGDQVTAELKTLHDFAAANTGVHIVVSHDAAQLAEYESAGLLGSSLSANAQAQSHP
jgi:glyoxylase-like metal-dependent hydrolase (beta-lactamase superfamily II)